MRIAVVANCQGEGIAAALNAMNPGIAARFVFTSDLQHGAVDLAAVFADSDLVLAQPNTIEAAPSGMAGKLKFSL